MIRLKSLLTEQEQLGDVAVGQAILKNASLDASGQLTFELGDIRTQDGWQPSASVGIDQVIKLNAKPTESQDLGLGTKDMKRYKIDSVSDITINDDVLNKVYNYYAPADIKQDDDKQYTLDRLEFYLI